MSRIRLTAIKAGLSGQEDYRQTKIGYKTKKPEPYIGFWLFNYGNTLYKNY
jgi:hypothetical protein